MHYAVYAGEKCIGYVIVKGIMGTDETIAEVASISHGEQEMTTSQKLKLTENLVSWGHLSPFEFAEVSLKIKCPIFVARQWMRHRTGNYLEKSGRYTTMNNWYTSENLTDLGQDIVDDAFFGYEHEINAGTKKEVARQVLPLSTFTEFNFKMDLRNLFNFLKLRMSKHAQMEIRQFANVIHQILEKFYPVSMRAFDEYILNSVTLDNSEKDALARFIEDPTNNDISRKLAIKLGVNVVDVFVE
jgi:thymidylate synthase (FAD)